MRVKSRWFRKGRPRTPPELGAAVAFIAWRVSHDELRRMRSARFDVDPGLAYFAFLSEFLVFLIAFADRVAHDRWSAVARSQFTTSLANRAGEILQDNAVDLLGAPGENAKASFVALVNERLSDYAAFGCGDDGPDFAFVRCFAHRVSEILPMHDRPWSVAQVVEVEAPDAIAVLRRAMDDLFACDLPRAEIAR
jgi:hypothetical protein